MAAILNVAISALDTPSSLLPFFVKDAFDITGRTVMANNEGGKHEAREKFIEEAGTSLFWIGGIPAVRWLINQGVKSKIDPSIQFKRINSDGIQNYYADKLEKTVSEKGKDLKTPKFSKADLQGIELGGQNLKKVQEKLSNAGFKVNETKGFYKKYHVGVTAAAVLINLAMLSVALPQLNLWLSRKLISKEVNGKKSQSKEVAFSSKDSLSLSQFAEKTKNTSKGKNPSFSGLGDLFKFKTLFDFATMAENAQMNPVNGMLLLDYGISGSRVTITPRNTNERIENAVKEGGIIFFFYFAADIIKDKLAKAANKFLNTPIDLDYKILNSKEFKDTFKNPHNKDEVLHFADVVDVDAELAKMPNKSKVEKKASEALKAEIEELNELKVIKMIDKELAAATKGTKEFDVFKNFTLQMAQKEGLIEIEKDDALGKWVRHSKKYIQTDKVADLNKNLKTFYEKALSVGEKTFYQNIEGVISKTKKVKIASIFANMAICCASLSFILPKIQYMIREHRTKTKSAPGVKHYQEMAEKKMI